MIAILAVLNGKISWSKHRCLADVDRYLADERKKQQRSQRVMASLIGVSLPTVVLLETKGRVAW
jgi:hypothetical protein